MTVGYLRRNIRARLTPIYGEREAEAMTRLIFSELKGWNITDLLIHEGDLASDWLTQKSSDIVERVVRHEPIQYVLGRARFFGMDFEVTPATLIPRPETEELIQLILDREKRKDLKVLDIGTGSGCIAVALALNLPFADVTAIDISEDALEVAKRNAERLHARVKFLHADIFSWRPAAKSFDIIVSNPPYIAEKEAADMESHVKEFEPPTALFVPDSDPLIYYRRIAEIGLETLTDGGTLYFEINPIYARQLQSLLDSVGYKNVEIIKDFSGKERMIVGEAQL